MKKGFLDTFKTAYYPSYIWLGGYVRPFMNLAYLTILTGFMIALSEMAVPKMLQIIVDDLAPEKQYRSLYLFVALIVAIFALTAIARTLRTKWQIRFSESVYKNIQLAAIRHLRRLGIPYFESHAVGDTLSLMNADLPRIQGLLRHTLPAIVQDLLMAAITLIFMATMNATLMLCVIPAFGLYCFIGPLLSKKMLFHNKRLHEQRAVRDRKAYESVSALAELRANNAHGWDARRYDETIVEMHRLWTIQQLWVRSRLASSEFFYYLGAVFVFLFAASLIQNGRLTIGEFIAFTFYFLLFIQTISRVFLSWADVEIGMQQVRRVYWLMCEEPIAGQAAESVTMPSGRGDIEVNNVTFAYPNGAQVLKGLSLSIPGGTRLALVGPTGHGKTSLLKLLGGFYQASAGEIRIDGVPLDRISRDSLHDDVGYIFQETYIFGRTVRDNIRFGRPGATDDEIEWAARKASIHADIERMREGYDTLVGERGVKLSGGQKQRIAIARLFLRKPRIILLDEATSALDSIHEHEVQQALGSLFEGRTVISVIHRIAIVKGNYDAVAVVEDGRVAEAGTYEELIARRGTFYRLLHGADGTERKSS